MDGTANKPGIGTNLCSMEYRNTKFLLAIVGHFYQKWFEELKKKTS
jgi:hypothetical protein